MSKKNKLLYILGGSLVSMSFASILFFSFDKDDSGNKTEVKEKEITSIYDENKLIEKGIEFPTNKEKIEKNSGSQDLPKKVSENDIDDSIKESENVIIDNKGNITKNEPKPLEKVNNSDIDKINKNNTNVYVKKEDKDNVKVNVNKKEVTISAKTDSGSISLVSPNNNTKDNYEKGTEIKIDTTKIESNLPKETIVKEKDLNTYNESMNLIKENVLDGYKLENIVVEEGFLIKDKKGNVVQVYSKSKDGTQNTLLQGQNKDELEMFVDNVFVLLNEKYTKVEIKNAYEKALKENEFSLGNVLFYFDGVSMGVEWK